MACITGQRPLMVLRSSSHRSAERSSVLSISAEQQSATFIGMWLLSHRIHWTGVKMVMYGATEFSRGPENDRNGVFMSQTAQDGC